MSVLPTPENLITRPLDFICQEIKSKTPEQLSSGGDFGIPTVFADVLKLNEPTSGSYWGRIPALTPGLKGVAHGGLVRFRCMIQDTFDPEYYLSHYYQVNRETGERTLCCGKYQDDVTLAPNCEIDARSEVPSERSVVNCIAIPGESLWVKELLTQQASTSLPLSLPTVAVSEVSKRKADADDTTSRANPPPRSSSSSSSSSATEEAINMASPVSPTVNPVATSDTVALAAPAFTCVVKLYDNVLPETRMCKTFEFIGVLSMSSTADDEDFMGMSLATAVPGSSSAHPMRLHAIYARPLDNSINLMPTKNINVTAAAASSSMEDKDNACTDDDATTSEQPEPTFTSFNSLLTELKSNCELARGRTLLCSALDSVLGGDKLAVTAVLIHLLTKVTGRQHGKPVGQLTVGLTDLNRTQATQATASSISALLGAVAPKVLRVPVNLTALNTSRYTPEKDYDQGCLLPGVLQVSDGTSLLMDETQMDVGELKEQGVRNLQAVVHLSQHGTLEYTFPYSQPIEMPADTPMLVLSAEKPILPCDIRVAVAPARTPTSAPDWAYNHHNTTNSTNPWYLTSSTKNLSDQDVIRQYLLVVRQIVFNMADDTATRIQTELVERLQRDRDNCTQEVMHILMTIARTLAISYGHSDITEEVWKEANGIVETLMERVRSAKVASTD